LERLTISAPNANLNKSRPPGTQKMADNLLKAYEVDIGTRTEGLEHSNTAGYE
jgi:hypothetical protein